VPSKSQHQSNIAGAIRNFQHWVFLVTVETRSTSKYLKTEFLWHRQQEIPVNIGLQKLDWHVCIHNAVQKITKGVLCTVLCFLRSGIKKFKLAKLSHFKFQKNLWNGFCDDTWEKSIYSCMQTGLCCGLIWLKITIAGHLVRAVHTEWQKSEMFWIQGKVHLWPYINQYLLWINMAESHNHWTTFSERCQYQMTIKLWDGLQDIQKEKSIYGLR
jgi:hypothetical protein